MRSLSKEELEAIARLREKPITERELEQSQKLALPQLGARLPIIHQVLTL